MGYQDDPNINRRRTMRNEADGWGAGSIILASLGALAIVFGIFFMMSDRNSNVANRTDRPAVTTGSSTVTTPTATTPAQPRAVEAPVQSAPATTTTGSGAVR
jgi:hypothetical protein